MSKSAKYIVTVFFICLSIMFAYSLLAIMSGCNCPVSEEDMCTKRCRVVYKSQETKEQKVFGIPKPATMNGRGISCKCYGKSRNSI